MVIRAVLTVAAICTATLAQADTFTVTRHGAHSAEQTRLRGWGATNGLMRLLVFG